MQPLDNIKVLDFSTLLPGPLAGLVLAEAGAEVIKIERPVIGEEMRHFVPMWGDSSVLFALLNRGKQALFMDLKSADTKAALKTLICDADILLEQFRPGVMKRLGLDYETVKKWNPGLIYCSISGYGQTGPKSQTAGHDLNYIGDTGLLDLAIGDAEKPTIPPALIADIGAGTYPALVNILLALISKQRTGNGTHLDIAMADNLFMFMFWAQGEGKVTGNWPISGKGLLTGGSPRYQIYPTNDGKFIAAAPLEEKFWQNFCNLIKLPHSHRNSTNNQQTIETIKAIVKKHSASHWKKVFENQDCCCSIVQTLENAMKDQHFLYRKTFEQQLQNNEGDKIPALPVCLVPQFRDVKNNTKKPPELAPKVR